MSNKMKGKKLVSFKELGKMKKNIEEEDKKKDDKKYEKKEAMKNRGMYHPQMNKGKGKC